MATIKGTDISETLAGTSVSDTILGGVGADIINAGAGNDFMEADGLLGAISYSSAVGGLFGSLMPAGSIPVTGIGASFSVQIGAMVDVLTGGLGDDTYLANFGGVIDTIVENSGEGVDTVRSLSNYTLAGDLENLELVQSFEQIINISGPFGGIFLSELYTFQGTALNGTGNVLGNMMSGNSWDNVLSGLAGDDSLIGFAGNDTLDGGIGADNMVGGVGNDMYLVDNSADSVNELFGEGVDLVQSSISLTLGANIEDLTLLAGGLTGSGNSLANMLNGSVGADFLNGLSGNDLLIGNAGNDTLDGGLGTDSMAGGAGNDRFFADNLADVISELAGEGDDYIYSRVSFTLGANVERLYLLESSAAVSATGNSENNILTGNKLSNSLAGGRGNDGLIGGLGNDTYHFGSGDNGDTIKDIDATVGNSDVLNFQSGISFDQLWFRQSGNSLLISVIGTFDKVTIQDWYVGNQNRVEQIHTTDGNHVLTDSNVQNLVAAMSSLAVPAIGQTTLNVAQHAALDTVLAANWS